MTYHPTPRPECVTCAAVDILTGKGITEVVSVAVKLRRPPEVVTRHLREHKRPDLLRLLTDQGEPLPEPDERFTDVHCLTCGALLASQVGRSVPKSTIIALRENHTCPSKTPVTQEEETTVTTPIRPAARELTGHPDKRIARQAAKVLAEQDKLTELWMADQGKAELRAKRDRLKRQLEAVEAELKGVTPALPSKAIREWAAANGVPCPTTGKLPAVVVQAWREGSAS